MCERARVNNARRAAARLAISEPELTMLVAPPAEHAAAMRGRREGEGVWPISTRDAHDVLTVEARLTARHPHCAEQLQTKSAADG